MTTVTADQEDEGFVYWLQGQEDERQVIMHYLRDVAKKRERHLIVRSERLKRQ
jgi:hypothetical protein